MSARSSIIKLNRLQGERWLEECFALYATAEPRLLPEKAAILPSDEKQASTEPRPPPSAGVSAIACLYFPFSSSRITIIKAAASYFACANSSTTAASLSRISFQPSA
jgi:hypothetical protein